MNCYDILRKQRRSYDLKIKNRRYSYEEENFVRRRHTTCTFTFSLRAEGGGIGGEGTDYLAMAQDFDTGSVLQIAIEDLSVTSPIFTSSMDEDSYLEALRQQLDLQMEEGMEMTSVDEENGDLMLGSENYKYFNAVATASGVDVNQIYAVKKVGDKNMIAIIYITADDASADELSALFS